MAIASEEGHQPRRGIWLALLAALLSLSSGCVDDPHHSEDVVLLTVDTLRADRLGAYGNQQARTPNIDRLARRGLLFSRAMTPMPRTTPGLATLMTGLFPHHHGSREVGRPIRGADEVTLLAEILARHGYFTLAVVANGAAGPAQGLDRGFEHFVSAEQLADTHAGGVVDRTLEVLEEAPRDVPIFLWVHLIDPHAPYEPPPPWGDDPAGEGCRQLARLAEEEGWEAGDFFSDRDGASSRALSSCSTQYGAEVAYADHQLGRLLAGFDDARGLDAALVLLTADHGENLGEQGLYYQHGPSLHDASVRVPLVIAGPGVPSGELDEHLVGLEDMLPTVLGYLGFTAPDGLDGHDLFRHRGLRYLWSRSPEVTYAEAASALTVHNSRYLYSGPSGSRHCFNAPRFSLCASPHEDYGLYDRQRDPHFEEDVSALHPEIRAQLLEVTTRWQPEEVRERSVREERFKLVERPRPAGGYHRVLFDLDEDPAERKDVSTDHPEVVRRLGTLLDRFTTELPAQPSWERDPEELDALKALGYLD